MIKKAKNINASLNDIRYKRGGPSTRPSPYRRYILKNLFLFACMTSSSLYDVPIAIIPSPFSFHSPEQEPSSRAFLIRLCIPVPLKRFVSTTAFLSATAITASPIAFAKPTGTAFPICLYFSAVVPANFQSSGNCWMRAYSWMLSGRSFIG